MKTLSGQTYPHRDAIRAAGGRWDAASKSWSVPDAAYAGLSALVSKRTESLDDSGVTSRSSDIAVDADVRVGAVLRHEGAYYCIVGLGPIRTLIGAGDVAHDYRFARVRLATAYEVATRVARDTHPIGGR